MGYFCPGRLRDAETAAARRDARAVLLVARARLREGGEVEVAALLALAEDERLTPRLCVRAAEYAAKAGLAALARAVGLGGRA